MHKSLHIALIAALFLPALPGDAGAGEQKPGMIKLDSPPVVPGGEVKAGIHDEIQMPPEAMEQPEPQGRQKKAAEDPFVPEKPMQPAEVEARGGVETGEKGRIDAGVKPSPAEAEPQPPAAEPKAAQTSEALPPPKQGAGPDAKDAGEPAAARNIPLSAPSGKLSDVFTMWNKRREALHARDISAADAETAKITALKREYDAPNLFSLASALVQESGMAMQGKDYERASVLAAMASELAPDLPSAHLQKGVAGILGGGGLVAAADSFREAFSDAVDDPATLAAFASNAVFVLAGGVLLALAAFVIAALLKSLRPMIHDFAHMLPLRTPGPLSAAVAAMTLLLPPALGAGPVPCIVIWAAAAWIYSSAGGRVLLAAAMAAFGLLPLANPYIPVLLDQGGPLFAHTYAVFRDGEASGEVKKAVEAAESGQAGLYDYWAAGLWLKREGKFAEAEKILEKAVEAHPAETRLLVNLGNLYLVQDRFREAAAAYSRAIETAPFNALAHLNMSRMFFREGSIEKGQREHQEAVRLDPALVDKASGNRTSINLFVVDARPGNADLMRLLAAAGGPRHEAVAGLVDRWMLGFIPRKGMPWLLGAAAAFLVVMAALRRRLNPSGVCIKCGAVACLQCNPEMTGGTHCGGCFHLYVARDVIDPRLRSRKETGNWQRARARRRLHRLLSILLPGGGQVLAGSAVRGFLVMLIVGLAAVYIATGGGPVPWRFPDLGWVFAWTRIFAGAAAGVVWLVSVRAAFRATAGVRD